VRSIIDYALPVFYHTLKVTEKNRLEQIQYRAAKLVTGTLHYSSREKLNTELGWESIETRAGNLGLSIIYKTLIGDNRPLIGKCMPALALEINQELRQRLIFKPFPMGKVKYKNSFFPYFCKRWEALPYECRKAKTIDEFKQSIKTHFSPKRYKFLSRGSKLGNSLLTRIRVGRSYLNGHSFPIGMSESPECSCHSKIESTHHYFMDCFLYTEERRILFDKYEQWIPNFKRFSKKKQLDVILNGIDRDNDDLFRTNTTLQILTQNFILQTKRFSK
jgi:hypothetical protein